MNKVQKKIVRWNTCYLLDISANMEQDWKNIGVPKKYVNKLKKALDLLFELNQSMVKK